MKKLALAIALTGIVGQAHAISIDATLGQSFSTEAGAITETFAGGLPGNYSGGMIRVGPGNPSGVSAAPPGITDNYYSVGPNNPDNTTGLVGTANFSATPLKYFGFYMGSPDTYNVVEVYNGASLLATYTGTDFATAAGTIPNGNQSVGLFVNIRAGANEQFDIVKFSTNPSINAFETDNHAVVAVPEPSTYAMMGLGLALFGLAGRRRIGKK